MGHPEGQPWALQRKVFVCLGPLGPVRRSVEPAVHAGDRALGEPTLGPYSTLSMSVHAQGTLHPVGHNWGP